MSEIRDKLYEGCKAHAIKQAGGELVTADDGTVIFDAATWEPTDADHEWVLSHLYYARTETETGEILHETEHDTLRSAELQSAVDRISDGINRIHSGAKYRVLDGAGSDPVDPDLYDDIDADELYEALVSAGIEQNQALSALGQPQARTWVATDPRWGGAVEGTEDDYRKQAAIFDVDPDLLTTTDDAICYDGEEIGVSWERYRDNR